jgi:thioredoxin reductase/ferredoxin
MTSVLLLYLLPLAWVVIWHVRRRRRRARELEQALASAEAEGRNEPPSLHPVVNPTRCIGSGACARACPEKALGVINGQAVLVNAAACIGHGACAAACPTQALTLVFGTARRGIDIPQVSPTFETNVPGLFIAGELGGMGLIRKAIEQGRQAVAAIRARMAAAPPADYDVVIVGAGPAGLSAALSALHHGLRYCLVEQEAALGGCVYHYPRHKLAMTAPAQLDGVGTMRLGHEVAKEKLLAYWDEVVARKQLHIHFGERMTGVEARPDGSFVVRTSGGSHHARTVLLALGRRGTPRRLGVPGEALPKVVYRLVDAEQYAGQRVLVVGGGDSALEAAVAVAGAEGTTVTLSYRGAGFNRVKARNREAFDQAVSTGRIEALLESTVSRIDEGQVALATALGATTRENDAVIVCTGGELPTALLKQIGIRFETRHGEA